MNRQMCDVCKTQDASTSYKVKESHMMHGSWEGIWEPYKKIDICDKCAEKILHMETLGSRMRDSLRRQKEINIKCGLEKREIKQGDIVTVTAEGADEEAAAAALKEFFENNL